MPSKHKFKTEVTKEYVTPDGVKHASVDAARAHMEGDFLKQFANWKPERVAAADLGETEKGQKDALAIESWARRLEAKRKARPGYVKQTRKSKATDAGAPEAAQPMQQAAE